MLSQIKLILNLTTNTYDTAIENIIDMYEKPLLLTLKGEYLQNLSAYPIIYTGLAEIMAGEFLNSLNREEIDTISISSTSISTTKPSGADLIEQGEEKLAPFKCDFGQSEINVLSSTLGEGLEFENGN